MIIFCYAVILSLWIKFLGVTIQVVKAIGQYFPVIRFVMLSKVVLTFQIIEEILSVVIKMKAAEHYLSVVLLTKLYKLD